MNYAPKLPWYVTADKDRDTNPWAAVWTIGPKANDENWRTDSGCDGYGMTKDDAEYAVRAVNAHDALVRACKAVIARFDNAQETDYDECKWADFTEGGAVDELRSAMEGLE